MAARQARIEIDIS